MNEEIDKFVISIKFDTDKLKESVKIVDDIIKDLSTKISKNLNSSLNFKNLSKIEQSIKKTSEQMQSSLKKANDPKKYEDNFKNILDITDLNSKKILGVLNKGLIGFGSYFGMSAGKEFLQNFMQSGMDLSTKARLFNINTDKFQIIQKSLELVGANANDATQAVSDLFSRLSNFSGDPQLSRTLKILGVSATNEMGIQRNPQDILIDIINSIAKMPKNFQAGYLQEAGLPTSFKLLTQLPQDQRNQIFNTARQNIMTESQVNKATDEAEKWKQIEQKWKVIGNTINEDIYPAVNLFTNLVNNLIGNLKFNFTKLDPTKMHKLTQEEIIKNNKGIHLLPNHAWDDFKNGVKNLFKDNIPNISNAVKIKNTNETDINKLLKATAYQETGGATDYQDRMFSGNFWKEGHGKYQVSQSAIKQIIGRTATNLELQNESFLEDIGKKYLQLGLRKAGGDVIGARAFYNGGQSGLRNWRNTGHGLSLRDEARWTNQTLPRFGISPSQPITTFNPNANIPHPANLQQHTYNNINNNHNNTVHVNNLNLPNQTNPKQFASNLGAIAETGWAYSRNLLA